MHSLPTDMRKSAGVQAMFDIFGHFFLKGRLRQCVKLALDQLFNCGLTIIYDLHYLGVDVHYFELKLLI